MNNVYVLRLTSYLILTKNVSVFTATANCHCYTFHSPFPRSPTKEKGRRLAIEQQMI